MGDERGMSQMPAPGAGELFLAFFRLGLTAFGGPAMVAYIRKMAVGQRDWLDEGAFKQGVAICQAIPGATAMQVAAYVGLRCSGPLGALAAYLGFALPASILMTILAALYATTHDLAPVIAVFKGLQVVVIALMVNATLSFGRATINSRSDILLGLGVAAFLFVHGAPVVALMTAALAGQILYRDMPGSDAAGNGKTTAPQVSSSRFALLLLALLLLAIATLFLVDRPLFDLARIMVTVDLFAFGGGYGSVPLMFNEVVHVRHLVDSKTFLDGIALGQVTPGPIVITATFVGYLLAGLPGALVGTIAIFSPSLIILAAVVPHFHRLRAKPAFQRALHALLVSFVGLLAAVTLRFGLAVPWDPIQAILFLSALFALYRKVDILWVVLIGAVLSVLLL